MRAVSLFAWSCALGLGGSVAQAGPDWVEEGDAGSTAGTGQQTVGTGNLGTISGTLSFGLAGDDFEDLYYIQVTNPKTFKFDLRGATFDTQVFIFKVYGESSYGAYGILGNDNGLLNGQPVPGSLIDGPANDGSGAGIFEPGLYLLAITGYGRVPMSCDGPIFYHATRTEISGPDGYGGHEPLEYWHGLGEVGSYRIDLEGVGFSQVPAPSALLAIGLTAALSPRRRRA